MPRQFLGLDVGGSSIKAGLVDLDAGRLVGDLKSAPTPKPSTPAAMLAVFQELVGRFPGSEGKVGIAMPSVVKHGKVRTAANIDHGWIGVDGPALVEKPLGRPAVFLNDADAAGVAEVKWGAGKGTKGTVIMLTFGTGIGTRFLRGRNSAAQHRVGSYGGDGAWRGGEVDLGARAHGGEARLARLDRARQRLSRRSCMRCSGPTCSFWVARSASASTNSRRCCVPMRRSSRRAFAGQAGVIGAALAAADA